MARATVLRCDICSVWDSAEFHVRNISVAGPKFDLCSGCRITLLISCGVAPELAAKYTAMVDERVGVRGTMPALSTAQDWEPNADGQGQPIITESPVDENSDPGGVSAPRDAPVVVEEPAEQPSSTPPPQGETEGATAPRRTRAQKS